MFDVLKQIKEKTALRIVFVLAVMLTLLRFFLASKIPLCMQGNTPHDDALLVHYATYMLSGQWLGPFTVMTCVKGISYPFFLALNYLTGLPLSFTQALCNVGSVLFFIYAIKSWIKNPYYMIFLYLFLIYSPVTFATELSGIIYRSAIVTPALLIVLGGALGLFLRKYESTRSLIFWSITLGLSFPFFWNLREDSIWLLPFFVAALFITALFIVKKEGKLAVKKCLILLIPFLCFAIIQVGQGLINQYQYGLFMINDRTGTAFASVISDLIKIDDGGDNQQVWISKQQLALAYTVSPTLASVSKEVNLSVQNWGSNEEDRGLGGDITAWALRDGVSDAGYYVDAQTMETFYRKVHKELSDAYESGSLTKREGFYVSGSARGMTGADIPFLIDNYKTGLHDLIHYSYYRCNPRNSTGSRKQIRLMEVITNDLAYYPTDQLVDGPGFGEKVQETVTGVCEEIADRINSLYRKTGMVMASLSFVAYIALFILILINRFKDEELWSFWVVQTGLLLSIGILFLGVVWFTSWMAGAYAFNIFYYTSPGLTLLQLVESLTLYMATKSLYNIFLKKRS